MPLILVVLMFLAVLGTALWITGNVIRYRRDVWHHWYSVGYRDASHGSYWYNVQHLSNYIVNAYVTGFNDGKNGTWQ